jgi:hypothetical protein
MAGGRRVETPTEGGYPELQRGMDGWRVRGGTRARVQGIAQRGASGDLR